MKATPHWMSKYLCCCGCKKFTQYDFWRRTLFPEQLTTELLSFWDYIMDIDVVVRVYNLWQTASSTVCFLDAATDGQQCLQPRVGILFYSALLFVFYGTIIDLIKCWGMKVIANENATKAIQHQAVLQTFTVMNTAFQAVPQTLTAVWLYQLQGSIEGKFSWWAWAKIIPSSAMSAAFFLKAIFSQIGYAKTADKGADRCVFAFNLVYSILMALVTAVLAYMMFALRKDENGKLTRQFAMLVADIVPIYLIAYASIPVFVLLIFIFYACNYKCINRCFERCSSKK